MTAMNPRPCLVALLLLAGAIGAPGLRASPPEFAIATPMPPPGWALLEREVLRANAAACREFFARYFDERGWLLCVERWGGDDGPDDAIENVNDWPILHALGAPDAILALYKRAWEGHLRQYTLARTVEVPFARHGMYYKEFPVMFDWLHNGEGLTAFNTQGLSDPDDLRYQARTRRYAGFYLNEDPGAPNYDPKVRIIRSMFNGSRGPLLRPATALDWAGDPIEIENRFRLGHGERSYAEMLAHFKDYTETVGDHPQNLLATSLAMNAYMLSGESKYRQWVLDYVDAWRNRMAANNGIIPTNVGLDGTIGGGAGGRWYGGVYGWGFSVVVPQTGELAHRNQHQLGFVGFANAYLLTGDDRYLAAWRRQADQVNAQRRLVDGRPVYPRMYGDRGWYDYAPQRYELGAFETWYLSMQAADRARCSETPWMAYLDGKRPDYPEEALRGDLARIRECVAGMRADPTTPDTRLADDPMQFNPASVTALIELALGGIHPGHRGSLLHCRLRYFDPARRRAGLPEDVAALVEKLDGDRVTVTLVNVNQVEPRDVVIQAGAYAEHQFSGVTVGGREQALDTPALTVRLAPGAGGRIMLRTRRYANQPRLAFPWN
jgi:hypothetical protein